MCARLEAAFGEACNDVPKEKAHYGKRQRQNEHQSMKLVEQKGQHHKHVQRANDVHRTCSITALPQHVVRR